MPDTWMPRKDIEKIALMEKWKTGLANVNYRNTYKWDPAACDAVIVKIEAALTAYAAYDVDNSTKNRIAKDRLMDEAISAMREFANANIRYNPRMTPENRFEFGIGPIDTHNTPETSIDSYPEAEGDTTVLRQVTINFWDNVIKKRGKPRGVRAAEIRWGILDHPPERIADLTGYATDTASPYTLSFEENERGKRVYFCLRWMGTTNITGPWSEIYSAVIP